MTAIASGGSEMGVTTIMMCLLFGTNFFLYLLFQLMKLSARPTEEVAKAGSNEKGLSKPFTGTLDCFTNLTSELFRTGLILALTYICENHWIFDHSSKSYSRDLFIFVLIVFFGYAIYTIKPNHDLSLLGREQTEEWKGWMQFIFLLYHYFHAEEVYNSVRVMITCYVWMTGFGNFSFFYQKRDFGWLRMIQMLWRLNFSCLLLMWTHGNTYILYYICPMHTFYFLVVYATMYAFSSINTTKWGIRVKLLALGVLIFIIWDINGGLFDILFAWLGTDSVIGAKSGSVWEYYFRTSLDHWSTFFGMIFALNFPLAEQFFVKAKGWPLFVAATAMAALTIWWLVVYYPLEKMSYNLTHSYLAIIPLTSYIFFRNITPTVRSGVSMSLHDLGKTTLETYLLQHHIWLTSNAKTLLTIVPEHPWINFALATMLFFVVSKELYRLTMSLRGMVLPDDKNIAWGNTIGIVVILVVTYVSAALLHLFTPSLLEMIVASVGLTIATLLLIGNYNRQIYENGNYRVWSARMIICLSFVFAGGILVQLLYDATGPKQHNNHSTVAIMPSYTTVTQPCLDAVSQGHWIEARCDQQPPSTNGRSNPAICINSQWVWEMENKSQCPIKKLSTGKLRSTFKGKNVAFVGDSEIRNVFYKFVSIMEPTSTLNFTSDLRHSNIHYETTTSAAFELTTAPSSSQHTNSSSSMTIDFIWAPMLDNVTIAIATSLSGSHHHYDMIVAGAACWDALLTKNLNDYSGKLKNLASTVLSAKNKTSNGSKLIWLQPTTIVTERLVTEEKRQYMNEDIIQKYRSAFKSSPANAAFDTVINPTSVSLGNAAKAVDGLHYTDDVYEVIAHMAVNGYTLHFPQLYSSSASSSGSSPKTKKYVPKTTGSMSLPIYGALALGLAVIMLFSMDSFFGIGYVSLALFGRSYDWEAGYGALNRKILAAAASEAAAATTPRNNRDVEQETETLL